MKRLTMIQNCAIQEKNFVALGTHPYVHVPCTISIPTSSTYSLRYEERDGSENLKVHHKVLGNLTTFY